MLIKILFCLRTSRLIIRKRIILYPILKNLIRPASIIRY